MNTEHLDAYGHMNWTVGNEDWVACFDAYRSSATEIAYHVVVDCESGGFTDTTESGTVPATAEGIAQLYWLPGQYADSCVEMYPTADDDADYGEIEWEDCDKSWRQHLESLLLAEPPEDADEDGGGEEQSLDYFNRYIAGDR